MKRSGNSGRRIQTSPVTKETEESVNLEDMFKEAELASRKREEEHQVSTILETHQLDTDEKYVPKTKVKRPYKRRSDVSKETQEVEPEPEVQREPSSEESEDEGNIDDENGKTCQDHLRCQYRKAFEKGIRGDLTKLGIAPEVIDLADEYYFEVTKGEIKRSNLRKGIMFACVFQAYKDLGKHQTPDYLMNLFKITRRVMSKGLTYFYPRSNKRSGDNGYITAEHFIPRIMETFNCKQEHIQAALKLYSQVKDKTTLFNSSNPQSVSSGLVYYYFKKINADIPGSTFGKAVGLSEITITKIASRIDEILSS